MDRRFKALGGALAGAFVLGVVAALLCLRRAADTAPAKTAPDLPVSQDGAPKDGPNLNPVDAAPVAPAGPVLDPLKIACAEDFQDWDELGCRG